MKRILFAIALLTTVGTAQAQHRHHGYYATGPMPHHYHHHHGRHVDRTAPLLGAMVVGGLVGYAVSRPQPVVVERPVYVERPTTVYVEQSQPVCSQWREVQYSDGRIYRERICNQ